MTDEMGQFRVFISAVSRELGAYRAEAARALQRKGIEVRDHEFFRQSGGTLLAHLRNHIEECDAVVLLVGEQCGSFPAGDPEGLATSPAFDEYRAATEQAPASYTHWEFLLARDLGKPTYVFFTAEGFTPDEPNVEPPHLRDRHQKFRDWARQSGQPYGTLTTTAKLVEDILVLPFRGDDLLPPVAGADAARAPMAGQHRSAGVAAIEPVAANAPAKVAVQRSCFLPCVVQVGFAGSRRLFDAALDAGVQADLEHQLQRLLVKRLETLRDAPELMLGPQHFLCTISQLAVGADTLLTRACNALEIPQRLFLPQQPGDFLAARGSDGTADFSDAQRAEAEALMDSEHIIQVRVVSQSSDRHTRFEEANLEILRVSDVVVCLLRAEAEATARPGGTTGLLERAIGRRRPTLELRVNVENGQVRMDERWHMPAKVKAGPTTETGEEPETIEAEANGADWKPPALPRVLLHPTRGPRLSWSAGLPDVRDYCDCLKKFASGHAKVRQNFFKGAAAIIIATHIAATFCATGAALISHRPASPSTSSESQAGQKRDVAAARQSVFGETGKAVPAGTARPAAAGDAQPPSPSSAAHSYFAKLTKPLLVLELLLLGLGFVTHLYLHHSDAAKEWALGRLMAEIVRSMRAIDGRHVYLEHLFHLPLPLRLRPLLRTLSALHLRSTRGRREEDWKKSRDGYISSRLTDIKGGQIHYYGKEIPLDKRRLARCQRAFTVCSLTALVATALKLSILLRHPAWLHSLEDGLLSMLALLAIVLPAAAVGALSWAAARDAEARIQTFQETLEFLKEQLPLLQDAQSGHEFDRLMLETEARLLGETAAWFARRSFIAVT